MNREELLRSVNTWNIKFPMDRWWRSKHNVAVMSPVHRECSFIHQLMEFEEDKLYMQAMLPKEEDKYIPGIGDLFKTPLTQEAFLDEAQREIDEMLKLEEQNGGG